METFLTIDVPAMLAGALASMTCALLGNYLVLRRMSLMGDAISHSVLPGLVIAFLIAGGLGTLPSIVGAAAAGVVTVVGVEALCKIGRVDPGAAMGVVFSILFALGVLLLEHAAARTVHLDADCVLYGQLEDVLWLAPTGIASLAEPAVWAEMPREVTTLAAVFAACALLVVVFFKELRITSFDPALATTLGFSATAVHYALMVLVSIAVVASFEAVGSILVIAMLICPPATARMLTDSLRAQVLLSVGLGFVAAVAGYVLAAFGPFWVGGEHSLNAAGMIAVVAGAMLGLSIVFSPGHGVVARAARRLRLSVGVAREDLLAMLYRAEEAGAEKLERRTALRALATTGAGRVASRLAERVAHRRGEIGRSKGSLALTGGGRASAMRLVRTHRLWERYLVDALGQRPDHVHRSAMALEHVTTREMRERLSEEGAAPAEDPHGRPIPPDG